MTLVKIHVLKILSRFVVCLLLKDRFFVESCTFVHFRAQEWPSLCMFVSNTYFCVRRRRTLPKCVGLLVNASESSEGFFGLSIGRVV